MFVASRNENAKLPFLSILCLSRFSLPVRLSAPPVPLSAPLSRFPLPSKGGCGPFA